MANENLAESPVLCACGCGKPATVAKQTDNRNGYVRGQPRPWKSFDAFLADMGPRPPGMTLERLDNNKGYSKDNCAWASRMAQARNQRQNRLNSEAVKVIRFGLAPQKLLAKLYGVHVRTIERVAAGETWSDGAARKRRRRIRDEHGRFMFEKAGANG